MKKRTILIIFIGLGAVLSGFILNFGHPADASPSFSKYPKMRAVSEQPNTELRETKQEQKKKQMNELLTKAKEMKTLTEENMERQHQEDIEYLKYRNKRIGPHYWKLAPKMFEQMLDEQSIDETWTSEKLAAVKELLTDSNFEGTTLNSVQCFESMCRIVVEHDDEMAYEIFKKQGTESGPLDQPSHGSRKLLENGRSITTVYLCRLTDSSPFKEAEKRMLAYVEEHNL